jgi:hypothetical protein
MKVADSVAAVSSYSASGPLQGGPPAAKVMGTRRPGPTRGGRRQTTNRLIRDQEVGGSNPLAPTTYPFQFQETSAVCGLPPTSGILEVEIWHVRTTKDGRKNHGSSGARCAKPQPWLSSEGTSAISRLGRLMRSNAGECRSPRE